MLPPLNKAKGMVKKILADHAGGQKAPTAQPTSRFSGNTNGELNKDKAMINQNNIFKKIMVEIRHETGIARTKVNIKAHQIKKTSQKLLGTVVTLLSQLTQIKK
jgi:hypothetical protein